MTTFIKDLDLSAVVRDAKQPRKDFSTVDKRDSDLANSIREHGVLQPIVVRAAAESGKYIIVAGERRVIASRNAGLKTIPAMLVEESQICDENGRVDEAKVAVLALTENMQREALGDFEVAEALARLRDEFGYTQQELAKQLGKSTATVSNLMQLAKPANQPLLAVCRPTADGRGISGALATVRGLPAQVQAVLLSINQKTGAQFGEHDFDKVKAFLAAGNNISTLESGIDAVLASTLDELQDAARDHRRSVQPTAAASVSPPADARDERTVVDRGLESLEPGMQQLISAQPAAQSMNATPVANEFPIPPLTLVPGVVLSGQQVKKLLKLLGANSEVSPALAHSLLFDTLRYL